MNVKRYVCRRSYGECCVDDVTASHAKANDAIVHFGHTCFSVESQSKQIVYVLHSTPNELAHPWLQLCEQKIADDLTTPGQGSVQVFLYSDLSLL